MPTADALLERFWSPLAIAQEQIDRVLTHWRMLADMRSLTSLFLLGGSALGTNTTNPTSIKDPAPAQSYLGVVPLPSSYTVGNGSQLICLAPTFNVTYNVDTSLLPSDLLEAAQRSVAAVQGTSHRYLSVGRGEEFFGDGGKGCGSYLSALHLSFPSDRGPIASIADSALQDVHLRPALEAYNLTLATTATDSNTAEARISARTALGAFRGLATFEQLFYRYRNDVYAPFGPYWIDDEPAFGWRAVLLDTSRHFFSLEVIRKQLDVMAKVKLNVFHWHITDSNSWPLHLDAYPELSQAAYSKDEVYTEDDIKDLIQYAAERGIDVVLEIDTPGHTASIATTHPDHIACFEATPWSPKANQPPAGQLRFADDKVAMFASGLFGALAEIVGGKYVGTGGDEINLKCMEEDQPTMDALAKKGWTMDQALDSFTAKSHAALHHAGKTATVWQEMVLNHHLPSLANNTIIYAWRSQADANAILNRGFNLIHASADHLYLDCGLGGWIGTEGGGNSWCDPFKSWAQVHSFDPYANVSELQRPLVLGGQASVWTEQVDEMNLETVLWPRAAAHAEVFWTKPGVKGYPHSQLEALPRIQDLRYRLVEGGVRATPLQPHWCALRPGQCNWDGA